MWHPTSDRTKRLYASDYQDGSFAWPLRQERKALPENKTRLWLVARPAPAAKPPSFRVPICASLGTINATGQPLAGSRYRCGKSTQKEQPVRHGGRERRLKSAPKRCILFSSLLFSRAGLCPAVVRLFHAAGAHAGGARRGGQAGPHPGALASSSGLVPISASTLSRLLRGFARVFAFAPPSKRRPVGSLA